MDRIADWSQADLRRFIVNLVLSDPGALPRTVATSKDVAAVTAQVSAVVAMPVGGMADWAGSGDPVDLHWLLCDGRAVNRIEYSDLFGAIGTTYGVGDGTTTFNLPDLRGRASVGPDNMGTAAGAAGRTATNNARGNSGGEETHTLSTAELAVHTHGVTDPQHTHGPPAGTSAYVAQGGGTVPSGSGFNWSTPANTGAAATGITIDNAGSGSAHNNMQPFQVVNKIIRAK